MATTARRVARMLREIHNDSFGNDQGTMYSITWSELRELAGRRRLSGGFLEEIGAALKEDDYVLIPLDNVLVVAEESELLDGREVPGSVVDRFLEWVEDEEGVEDEVEEEDLEV